MCPLYFQLKCVLCIYSSIVSFVFTAQMCPLYFQLKCVLCISSSIISFEFQLNCVLCISRPVKIIRLIGKNTIEEIILKRAEDKLKLTSTVIPEIRPSKTYIVHDHMQKSDHLKSVWLFSNMFSLLTSNCTCILYLIKHKLKAIHSVTYLSFNLSRYLHLMQKMQHCCTLCPFQYELQHLFQNVAHP